VKGYFMIIKKIILKNFKKHQDLTVEFGQKTIISGGNGIGKSTIYDAFCFCFFGKDASGNSDASSFKPKGMSGVNVNVSVEVHTDECVAIRSLKEKYTMKAGEIDRVLTGHEQFFEFDGLEMIKRKFDLKISSLYGEAIEFNVLSNITGFINLKTVKDKRSFLLSDAGELANLDDEKSRAKVSLKKIKETIKEIPVRIDEKLKDIKESKETLKDLETRKDDLRSNLSVIQGKIATLSNNDSTVIVKESILKKKEEMSVIKSKAKDDYQNNLYALQDKLRGYEATLQTLKDEHNSKQSKKPDEISYRLKRISQDIENTNYSINIKKSNIQENLEKIKELRNAWLEIEEIEYAGESICYACEQPLPKGKIESAKKAFLITKITDKKRVEEKANRLKAENKTFESEVVKSSAEVEKLASLKKQLEKELEELGEFEEFSNKELEDNILKTSLKIDDLEEKYPKKYFKLKDEVEKLEVDSLKNDSSDILDTLSSQERAIQNDIDSVNISIAELSSVKNVDSRVKELRAKLLESTKKQAALLKTVADVEAKITDEINRIEKSVNSNFKVVTFNLFETQINGGIRDICDPTVNRLSYTNLSDGEKIRACVDITQGLQRIKKRNFPLWIDRFESVENPYAGKKQNVLIEVRKNKPLKIEVK
jgi:DNA repair exonuclease SbcCD ATPase subunit